jgi:hypothetical protein
MHYLDVGDTVEGEVRWCCTASGFVMPLTSGLCWKTSHWTCRRGSTTGSPDLLALAKTTILRLISGLYTPERGTVRIDDRDPVVDSAPTLYLPQFVQLYRGSILENLRIFSGGASLRAIDLAAQETGPSIGWRLCR